MMNTSCAEEKIAVPLACSPTLCFDLKYYGDNKNAEAALNQSFHPIKTALEKQGFVALCEALHYIDRGSERLFRKLINIKPTTQEFDFEIAKRVIKQFLSPYFFVIDFLKQARESKPENNI